MTPESLRRTGNSGADLICWASLREAKGIESGFVRNGFVIPMEQSAVRSNPSRSIHGHKHRRVEVHERDVPLLRQRMADLKRRRHSERIADIHQAALRLTRKYIAISSITSW